MKEHTYLYKLRQAKGLTQVDVAIAVGVSLASYRMWEKGVTTPREDNLNKLHKVLGKEEK